MAYKKVAYKKAAANKAGVVLKKDGTPDRRYSRKSNSKAVVDGLAFTVNKNTVTLTKGGRRLGSATVNVTSSVIGCGVRQVYGLNGLNVLCRDAGKSLAPQMVATLLTSIRNMHRANHLILSNNERGAFVNDALNHVATASKPRRNPGTGSMITVWTF